MVEKNKGRRLTHFLKFSYGVFRLRGEKREKKNTKTNESFIGFRVFLSSLVSPLKPNTPLV
jgi:hypothetical protein